MYGTTQKMRAAVSHKFGRDHKLGTQPWSEHPMIAGKSIVNPSLSVMVSQYMVSLHRRKVWSGEAVTSAQAIDEVTMKCLWDFVWATPCKEYGATSCKRKAENPAEWAGFMICSMLLLLYLVSMICLPCYDEALQITWADITFQGFRPGDFHVRLELPFRKTHQYRGIAPFYVYADEQFWWMLVRERCKNLDGFIFWKKIGTDSVSVNLTDGMTSNAFLECFHNNLLDIGVDSCGCQFLYKVCRWDFRDICDWGGWAENFNNPGTIFKYLLSWNDNPREKREHYMNPNRLMKDPCHACGRTCHCA
ncbi:uncharacterized protein BJ212DRAFT_1444724 [Suillus subaureus]|uniref:Uncharacterized protein n=1 Tax=Suillus subaureus TaxID=48587 RepID=A0A9P7EJL3_9AGAM|nr:uncharacterized protein BJ212DRAFT_1444724 [Suillus subaureus]KAG1823640.1 hypothetical protein BJ212DRAFT_1444724 [Suillus subaureus]